LSSYSFRAYCSLIGLNFILPSFVIVVLSIIFILNLNSKVLIEEKILLQQYDEARKKYYRKTNRYL